MQAHAPHGVECAQTLHHIGLGLLNDLDIADDKDQNQHHQDRQSNGSDIDVSEHVFPSLFNNIKCCLL